MKKIKLVLTILAALNVALATLASQAAAPAELSRYRDYLEPMGYRISFDESNNKALVYDKKTNDLAMEIPFTAPGELKKFSPSSLNKKILDEMMRLKSAATASGKASISHSVKNLPAESLMFFVSMGAVTAGQLILNYSQNPNAMNQHIEHSLSPIGTFGFFTFMYSQGLTSNLLAMYMKNPRYHHMIPYLGMTVGAFLQSYLSQFASDPNVKACAAQMMGQKKSNHSEVSENPCDQAYEYFILHKKIWEFAPGISSMLISSGLAGVVQSVAKKAIRITGADVLLLLSPAGMELKGIRLLFTKGLQIATFVSIDAWLSRHVTFIWKNIFNGFEFWDIQRSLSDEVTKMKQTKWQGSDTALQTQVKLLRSKMADWRMINLAEIYEAHQNWSESLIQLTGMFNASATFYSDLIGEIRNSRYSLSYAKLLERDYPFNGIGAKNLSQDKADLYLFNPHFIESMQIETIADAATKAKASVLAASPTTLAASEKAQLLSLVDLLKSNNREQIIMGLNAFLTAIDQTLHNMGATVQYKKILHEMYTSMGKPMPLMEKGRGYLVNYENSAAAKEAFSGVGFYRQVGRVMTPKMTDYLVMQMLCGPDAEKKESSVKNSNGFPSVFLPPTVHDAKDKFELCKAAGSVPVGAGSIYSPSVNALEYLITNMRSSILGDKENSAFQNWWSNNVDTQMQKAFEEYGKHYDQIVAKLVKIIFQDLRSASNTGPIANGAMKSALQEERAYLGLLESLLMPTAKFNLDFRLILEQKPKHAALIEVEAEFTKLINLLKKIQVSESNGRVLIKSDLENYELQEQVEKIQAALSKVSSLLGVGEGAEQSEKVIVLNQNQHQLAVACLENLQALASEVMNYGTIANAVSWDKIRNLKQQKITDQKLNTQVQERLVTMKNMMMKGIQKTVKDEK